MRIMKVIIVLTIILIASSSYAQHFDYKCYTGVLSNPKVKDITEIRIGIAKKDSRASFVIFSNHSSKYLTDISCTKNYIGRCGLLDDSGAFEILSISSKKMRIQFHGTPKLLTYEDRILPIVDSQTKPKVPIRMDLAIRPKSACSYDNILSSQKRFSAIKNNSAAPSLAAKGRFRSLCTSEDKKKYFSKGLIRDCLINFREEGWVNFYMSPHVIVDIIPNRMVREKDGIKIWAQFFMADPVDSNNGEWHYDYVKSISKYYCGKKQTRMIQATYSLNGRNVYERSSMDSILEEIEPETINESLYNYVCKK